MGDSNAADYDTIKVSEMDRRWLTTAMRSPGTRLYVVASNDGSHEPGPVDQFARLHLDLV